MWLLLACFLLFGLVNRVALLDTLKDPEEHKLRGQLSSLSGILAALLLALYGALFDINYASWLVLPLAASIYSYVRWRQAGSRGWLLACGASAAVAYFIKNPGGFIIIVFVVLELLASRFFKRLAEDQRTDSHALCHRTGFFSRVPSFRLALLLERRTRLFAKGLVSRLDSQRRPPGRLRFRRRSLDHPKPGARHYPGVYSIPTPRDIRVGIYPRDVVPSLVFGHVRDYRAILVYCVIFLCSNYRRKILPTSCDILSAFAGLFVGSSRHPEGSLRYSAESKKPGFNALLSYYVNGCSFAACSKRQKTSFTISVIFTIGPPPWGNPSLQSIMRKVYKEEHENK